MMYNYQREGEDSMGFVRLLRFDPARQTLEVSTYSPYLDQWGYAGNEDPDLDRFTLPAPYLKESATG